MEVRWTVHVPQAMQQHGGGPRLRYEQAPPQATAPVEPARTSGDATAQTDQTK